MAVMVPSNFSIHCFSTEIDSQQYKYDVLKMRDSLFIIVNAKNTSQFEDLSYAIQNTRANTITSIQIFGDYMNEDSRNLVHHLGKRLKKNIYLSLNVSGDRHLHSKIEQQLFQEIQNNVDKF